MKNQRAVEQRSRTTKHAQYLQQTNQAQNRKVQVTQVPREARMNHQGHAIRGVKEEEVGAELKMTNCNSIAR